jgi:transcriptional regulator with XRE-family HTH domain
MPEIGATLREARMRARIDISEIEAETKIRAKYLRALENEEWDLLPGPTYVRSFLRTYAEALGLDAKLLLEEYKLRHERPSDHDLMPIAPPRRGGTAQRGRGRPPRRGISPWVVVVVIVVGILVALYALGQGDNGEPPTATTTTPRTTTTRAKQLTAAQRKRRAERRRKAAARARIVRLQVLPTGPGPVFVCLEAAGDRQLIPGANLQPSASAPTFRSSRFRVTLGNGDVRLRIDRRVRDVPAVRDGIGYEITKKKVRTLTATERPTCVR